MTLVHFATETYCALRYKGIPSPVAQVTTYMETLKFNIVTCHKENIVPSEQDIHELKYISDSDLFVDGAENTFKERAGLKPSRLLRTVN